MILTDDEIDALWADEPSVPQRVKRRELVRIAQTAVLRKLATVSVEPVAFHAQDGIVSVASHIDKDKFLFTTEALAAARAQALEEAAKVAEGYPKYGDATAAEIRALIT